MPDIHSAILASEIMFGGSLVATDLRPAGLLSSLRREVLPEHIEDNFTRVLLKAAMFAETTKYNIIPSSDNLATIIIQESLFDGIPTTPDEILSYKVRLIEEIDSYSRGGVNTGPAINSLAAAINDHVNTKRLHKYAQQAQELRGDDSLTAQDLYDELSQKLERARPDAIEARIYSVNDLRAAMQTMRNERRAMLGAKLMTMPSEWWMHDYIPYLLPGLLYTLTGLTGRGKSSVLQQLADHLAKCGFKVIYFHAEDDITRQIDRMTRRLAHASPRELISGDPRNKYAVVANMLREREQNSGGSVIYCHCIGSTVNFIKQVTQHYRPDIIIIDYLQKLNRAPQLAAAMGNDPAALAAVVEEIKHIAENDKHNCAVILGSQEAEHESGAEYRKGTLGTRQAEHKAQVIIEIERTRITNKDVPEIGPGGEVIAGAGDLSGFGYMNIVKNNDGPTGSVPCIFHGMHFEIKSLEYRHWERAHPGEIFPLPRLTEPDAQYYANHEAKARVWEDLDIYYDHPKLRREQLRQGGTPGIKTQNIVQTNYLGDDRDIPF